MKEMNLELIKRNLKAARVRDGLSQDDVAAALGVTRQTVINWEADPRTLNLDKIMSLAKLYNCNPAIFFGD